MQTTTANASTRLAGLLRSISGVVKGKEDVIQLALTTLLARGHLLIEDVPGVGKTTLAQALARSFDCSFQRIQFTSDMLPSDVIGVSVFNPATQGFEFKPGPIFAKIGPGLKSNPCVAGLNTLTPITSLGSMSEVN